MARSEDAPSIEGDAEERRLIDRSAAGDQEAFRQLVIRYHRLVINVAFRALGDLSLAEDVAQDVFIKVYKALPGYRHDKPFKHWLHRVAANAVTDDLRFVRILLDLATWSEAVVRAHPGQQVVQPRGTEAGPLAARKQRGSRYHEDILSGAHAVQSTGASRPANVASNLDDRARSTWGAASAVGSAVAWPARR